MKAICATLDKLEGSKSEEDSDYEDAMVCFMTLEESINEGKEIEECEPHSMICHVFLKKCMKIGKNYWTQIMFEKLASLSEFNSNNYVMKWIVKKGS